MTALHELATDYRLPLLASRLATVQLPPPHPTAQPLVDDLWIQIAQEGLSPANLSTLMTRYSDHPFERGLMAWDALTSSLLLDDGLLRSLRAAARPVAPLLGDRRRGHAVAAPFERVMRAAATRWQGATRILLDDAIAAFDFGAMWLERGRLTVEHRAGLLDHAERLDRAHLPTTAQVGARLASLLGERRGITVWVSSMLDLDDERALATARHLDGAVPRGWVEARRALSTLDLQAAEQHLPQIPETAIEATLVRADLGIKRGTRAVEQAQLDGLRLAQPMARYPARLVVASVALDGDPTDELDLFLRRFGHDAELWLDLLRLGSPELPWFDALLGRLSGDLLAAPHSRVLWTILAAIVDSAHEDEATTDELNGRFAEQITQQPGS